MLVSLLGFAALFALAFLGLPLGLAMTLVGTVGFMVYRGVMPALSMAAQQAVDMGMSHGLSVIPLFVLMGAFIFKSGLADDLFSTAQRWVGGLRGGLGHAAMAASGGFGAVCGSSLAVAATMARVAVPEMRRHGYDPAFAGAAIAAGGTLGILIPPSVPMVIYGVLTETDIGKLFAAGVVPGIVLMLLYMVAVWATALWQPQKVGERVHYPWPERLRSLLKVVPVLGLFVLVLGGLYVGIFTPTESAGVGAFGGFVFMLLRGRANWVTVREALAEAALLTAMLLPVTIGAGIFTNFLTIAGLTSEAAAWVQGLPVPPMGIVVAICLIYIVLGCVFDGLAMIFLTVPIFFPIITALQLDPIWFGIIVVIVVELGLITPPMGMNVFVVQGLIPDVSTWRMFANVGAFVVAALVCLGLVLAWPQLALWLPSLMR
jgi:C4-dicarboxylate transporter, DctM subunit